MLYKWAFMYICVFIHTIQASDNYIVENGINEEEITTEESEPSMVTSQEASDGSDDVVTIQLYYECLCPDCRRFDTLQFKQTVLDLGPYLDVHLYPYGNAETEQVDGHYEFKCQHGPAECYGNKLHACAIDELKNITSAVVFNSCLMSYLRDGKGSDDAAADTCGTSLNIDSESIKVCAKGDRGTELLKYYGDESEKAAFNSVPHILVNGVSQEEDNFKENVCNAFKNPPPECSSKEDDCQE